MNCNEAVKYDNNKMLISYLTIRNVIGVLGILFPFVLFVGSLIFSKCNELVPTLSEYYYTVMRDFFVGTLCAIGLYLITYKGYDRKDRIATNLAGIFAFGIAFFPSFITKEIPLCIIDNGERDFWIHVVHFASATLFFITFAYISIFLFTKASGSITKQKRTRNKIYRICGFIIILSIALTGLYYLLGLDNSTISKYKPVFYLETIALVAFGISWLTKGEVVFPDSK